MADRGEDGTIYVVQQWQWRVNDDASEEADADDPRPDVQPYPDYPDRRRLVVYRRSADEGGVPVRAFRDYRKAEAFRREQEQARRAKTNPFRYGWSLEARSSLDEGRFRDWLLDAGLTPPDHQGEEKPEKVCRAWEKWWYTHRPKLTADSQQRLAQALNNALAGWIYGQGDAPGRTDLAWLDEHFVRMDRLTPVQRSTVRLGMIGSGLWDWPSNDGERDFEAVEETWRDWWDVESPDMTEYQRDKVWEALDKVRFYEVVELHGPA